MQDTEDSPEQRKRSVKPDPFFKAKKKAEVAKVEKNRIFQEKKDRIAQVENKVQERKKRHVRLSVRTATGQPVVRNRITDVLAKLQAEQQ